MIYCLTCSFIHELKFKFGVSYLIYRVNYIFILGVSSRKLHKFLLHEVCINVPLISEVRFRVRKS